LSHCEGTNIHKCDMAPLLQVVSHWTGITEFVASTTCRLLPRYSLPCLGRIDLFTQKIDNALVDEQTTTHYVSKSI